MKAMAGAVEVTEDRPVQRLGGRGCNKFVPVLGGNGTKIAPTGDIFNQPLDKCDEFGASLSTM